MKKIVVILVVLASAFQALAEDVNFLNNTFGAGACSEENKPQVLFALDRIAQEKQARGQDASALLSLEAQISSNSNTRLSDQTLKEAGLNDDQVAEIKGMLTVEE